MKREEMLDTESTEVTAGTVEGHLKDAPIEPGMPIPGNVRIKIR